MCKWIKRSLIPILFLFIFFLFGFGDTTLAKSNQSIILYESTDKQNLYPAIEMIRDQEGQFTIDDIVSDVFKDKFKPVDQIKQQVGFFDVTKWLRFEIENLSDEAVWLIEFAFPLIYEVELYTKEDENLVLLHQGGANYPFHHREISHRNLVFNLEIEPGTSKTFYVKAVGGADLHPPITLWNHQRFIEKTEHEFLLLGIFYGVIIAMIFYNLFLFFSLRMRSYLYYVLVISFALFGHLSSNGFGFQYFWSHATDWNLNASPFWVAMTCIAILIFTRKFLNVDHYIRSYKYVMYTLIPFHLLVICLLPFFHYPALYIMAFAAFSTFFTVLTTAIIALKRGARQARFYILGWLIFLSGIFITTLERMVILPYSVFTEYASQAALSIEVVLLSLALADKISLIRKEKEFAEKKAKENQALAMENLKKADELKDEFLAVTSHELRTPLYGMIGIAESLRDGIVGELSGDTKHQLSMIIRSGQRLTRLVDEILDFSQLKYDALKLKLQPVDIKSIIDIVIAVTTPLAHHKNLTLISDVAENLPSIQADENRLQQILYNLVDNAIKYTEEGKIIITAYAETAHVIVKVIDTGNGISSEQMETIFEPFQQGDIALSREVGGIGIGLNIAKRLIDLHGGKLKVSSTIGEGTTFTVNLPIGEQKEPIDLIPTNNQKIMHDKENHWEELAVTTETLQDEGLLFQLPQNNDELKPKILVADDEIVNLQVLMNQLSLNGYDVLTATRGDEVLEIIDKHNIDLLILDIMMPGMSGYHVCQNLRKTYSIMELPILMLTARDQVQDKMLSFASGANDYLVKPCDKQELLSRVKTLVRVKLLNEELVQMNLELEEKVVERTYELKVANDNLRRMADSRRQLLENIAHELGTPVTLIHHYIQSVQKGMFSATDEHYYKLVKEKILVMNRLIDDLFELAKYESGEISLHLKEFCLNEWVERLYNRCKFSTLKENRQFIHGEIPSHYKNYSCFFDQERMVQLFGNLISNAIKSTQESTGKISMEVKILDSERLLIQVTDNGHGIQEEDIPYIFERFYHKSSSDQEILGTGLGLAIVKQIVESHHGEIIVTSMVNEGTTFSITLPIKKSK